MYRILGIESSCDETGVALVNVASKHQKPQIVAHALHSQIAMHADYGGVVPELASREHIHRVLPLIRQTLHQAQIRWQDVHAIAYTQGPGLAGALLVGAAVAQGLAVMSHCPALPIHHLEGHLLSPFIGNDALQFPFVALLVSGGHTQLMWVQGVGNYTLLGETVDDAAGEAFDKCAKLMGLGYPGGPKLAALAKKGNPKAWQFPRPLLHRNHLDFSFAGLKTAVLTQLAKCTGQSVAHLAAHGVEAGSLSETLLADLAASVQVAILDVLIQKTLRAIRLTEAQTLVVAGGVGANAALRQGLLQAGQSQGFQVHFPDLMWCTDNGAMIAMAAAMRYIAGKTHIASEGCFDVKPRWSLIEEEGFIPPLLSRRGS